MKPIRPLFSILALAILAGCSEPRRPAASADLPPAAVHLAVVQVTEMPTLTAVAGTVRPVQRAVIAAKIMGTIDALPVALGQRVEAGQLLAKISAGEIAARVLQAKSQLNQVSRDLARERDLLAKGASTPEMVKNLDDRHAMTEALVHEAEIMLSYTDVRAPFAGVISRKPANAGDLAAPGAPLVEIEGTDAFQIEAGIPDSLAARMKPGAPLAVEVPATGIHFTGTLVELSSAADTATRTVPAKISVPAGIAIGSGQFARVEVPGDAERALFVPTGAVSVLGQLERVFVAQNGRAQLRLVKTGAVRDGRIDILAGLSDGESIIVDPPAQLRDGQRLEVRR